VTQQEKEHNQSLRQFTIDFRTLSEQLPLGVSIIGPDGTYEYINPKFTEIYGYTLQDFHNGREWFRLAFPDMQYKKKLISEWLQDLKEKGVGEIRPRTFTITCKDGTEKVVHLGAVATHEGKQICSWEDITEQKQAEGKLAKIVDGVAIPTFAIDKEHKLINWNTALEALSGIKREQVIGTSKQWLAFYPQERPVMADLIVDEASESEIKKYYRGKYKKSSLIEGAYEAEDFFLALGEDGRWLHFTAAPIKNETGEVTAAIEMLEDITERKRAEQFSEVLLHSVGVAVFIIQDGKIQYVNPMFQEQSGYTNKEIIGTYSLDLVCPEDRELVRKKAIEHLKKQSTLPYEYRFAKRDGETMWVLERVVSSQYKGKQAVIGYFVDITGRK